MFRLPAIKNPLPVPALLISMLVCCSASGQQHTTLAIGSPAPDFHLKCIDGKYYTLSSFKKAKLLLVIFMCNHCPTSQAYEQRIIQLVNDYHDKGVAIVGINPNNPASLRLDELGYSDVGDSYDDMKVRAKDAGFNFPYLYDGDDEAAANKYGPVSTPHVFIFDSARLLRYQGRVDDTENPGKTPKSQDTRNALNALLNGQPVPVETTKVFGCSIKWIEKKDWIIKAQATWAKEAVNLDAADADSLKNILANNTDKLRLIQFWNLRPGGGTSEFPELVTINHMYRDRGLELVSVNTTDASRKDSVHAFLKTQEASGLNFLFNGNTAVLAQNLTTSWDGKQPYTLLVEPGGKIAWQQQGFFDAPALKKLIFFNHLIGRIYN